MNCQTRICLTRCGRSLDSLRGMIRQSKCSSTDGFARSVHDLGLELARDDQHLLLASQRGWIMITHDRTDFLLLHGAWMRWFSAHGIVPGPSHAGILVNRLAVWTARVAATQIDAFVASGVQLANGIYEWTPSRGWIPAVGWEDRTARA